ncbi:MAG: hypothetical protein M3Y17_01550 [Actinomycetota bacterium]|nr:hypothetical protein [Actinomycetota bacterium]
MDLSDPWAASDKIDSSFFVIPPRVGNLLLYVLCLVKPPPWLWKRLLRRVRASSERQPLYPRLAVVLRTLYLGRRALAHFARMDFSIFPDWTGYVFWRAGLVGLWWRRLRLPKPERPEKWASPAPTPAQAPGSGAERQRGRSRSRVSASRCVSSGCRRPGRGSGSRSVSRASGSRSASRFRGRSGSCRALAGAGHGLGRTLG